MKATTVGNLKASTIC